MRQISYLWVSVVLLSAGVVQAQREFGLLQKRHLPVDAGNTFETLFVDVDQDGDQDLVIGKRGFDVLMINVGNGVFVDESTRRLPRLNRDTTGLDAADVDGDGDLDLILGRAFINFEQNELWLNDGSGRFVDATAGRLPARLDNTSQVATGDVDGDGDVDIVFGNRQQNTLLLNSGAGFFTDATASQMPVNRQTGFGVLLVDVDGDADLDLVTPGLSGPNTLYTNDGAGVFRDVTLTQMPATTTRNNIVRAGDVDGDGDTDLVLAGFGGTRSLLLLNDGSGSFTDVSASNLPLDDTPTIDLDIGDVDGDGDPDLVFGNGGFPGFQDRLYLNDGLGVFTDATVGNLPVFAVATNTLKLGDVDGDGDPDLALAHPVPWRTELYLNDGCGRFTDTTRSSLRNEHDDAQSVIAEDFDRDGDLDLLFGIAERARFFSGDGTGRFEDATDSHWPPGPTNASALVASDVDGDGDMDVLAGSSSPRSLLQFRNDGRGRFVDVSASTMPIDSFRPTSFAAGDVTGDGAPDIVLGGTGGNTQLFVNDGTGSYSNQTAGRFPLRNGRTQAVELGDVDGDGDLDIVLGEDSRQNALLINDGAGFFADVTSAQLPVDTDRTFALKLADVDGDGDHDLVLGNFTGINRLYDNDGSGRFTDVSAGRIPPGPRGVVVDIDVADADGDGDMDLIFGQRSDQNRYYRNDGTGRFTDATSELPPDRGNTTGVLFRDLDDDGDQDLVFANQDLFGNSVLINRRRQVEAPFVARRGERFPIEITTRPDGPPLFSVAVGVVAADVLATPIRISPFGVWRLDPAELIELPPVLLPPGVMTSTLELDIPANSALKGVALHFQFGFLEPLGPGRLSNLLTETVL